MCGLAGFIKINHDYFLHPDTHDIALNLFITSELRGLDSSGAAGVWRQESKVRNKSHRWGWNTVKGSRMTPSQVWERLMGLTNLSGKRDFSKYDRPLLYGLIGHSRAATKGSVTDKNAHPFVFDNHRFVGVHNGTITNAPEVLKEMLDKETPLPNTLPSTKDYLADPKAYTDSEVVLYCIYRWGIKAVYPHLEGAWALVFFRESDNTLSIIRNDRRTLMCYGCPRTDAIYWSSESRMLEFALERESKRYKNDVRYFKPHTLHQYDLSRDGVIQTDHEIPWTHIEDLEPLRPKGYTYSGNSHHGYGMYSGYGDTDNNETGWWKDRMEKAKQIPKPKKFQHPMLLEQRPGLVTQVLGIINQTDDDEEEVEGYPSECVNCNARLDFTEDTEMMEVKGVGWACGDCCSSLVEVIAITDQFEETIQDHEWTERFLELDKKERTG